ncbi:hypothetical protein BDZ45DRAFT_400421 [Acephala macrosclerotiorum]|nr:hypothetical protein BDZ45DRAFT_400421 [Acephala macrosclerotiorum]
MSPRVQCYILQTPSYSDGFEGKEAEPIGRLMPVKGTIRWKEAQHKMPFRMPQLILVPEKSSSPTKTDIRPRQRKKRQSVVDLQSRPKDPATEKRLCRVQAKQQSQLGNGPQSQPQVEVASIEQQDHRMDFNELPDADQGSNDEPQNDNQMEVAPSIQHHDPMQENGQPELHDESNDYHADPASPDPSTPKRLSSDEGDSKDLPSTSPLKREQQTKHIAKEIKEPAKSTKASNSSNGTKMSQAMSNIASTTKKTKKQAKADFEAMYELSMVSVKRRHLSDDEDESQSEYEEGDTQEEGEDGHEVRDDDGRSGDEGQRPDSDDVNEETESAEEAEGDGPSLNPEQEAETDNDAMCQDDDEPKLLGEDDIDKDTSGEQRDTQNTSLKFMARLVPDQSSRMYRGSDLSGLLQNKNFLGKNRHSQPSGRQNSQHHKSCAPSRWDAHFDSSWRPEVPASNSLEIEVDDEIYDSPTQPLSQARLSGQNYNSRQRSRLASRPLPLAPSRPRSPILENTDQNSQGSVILGNTQNFVLPVSIPETQLSNEGEEPRSQIYEVPSYFSQAIQNLENPNSKHLFSRTKSTPARVHFEQAQTDARLLTASAMFVKTISPVRSTLSQRLPTLREESGTSSQSLHVLTRRASSSMGTRPADSRRRMQPAVYNPPFLNPRGVEGARA